MDNTLKKLFGLDLDPPTKHFSGFLDELPSLEGKTVAVTGTTSGTGFWVAAAAIKKNATAVFLVNRDSHRATTSLNALQNIVDEEESITELVRIDCDFADLESVRNGAETLNEIAHKFGGLNVLGNNAGIMAFPDDRTKDGYDIQMQVNHLGQYLFTRLVLPSLLQKYDINEECRIVQHSSGARHFKSNGLEKQYFQKCDQDKLGGNSIRACISRYHQSKLANSCFAMALAKEIETHDELDASRFKSVAADPGVAMTSLGANLFAAHKSKGFWHSTKLQVLMSTVFVVRLKMKGSQSCEDGALPLIQAMFGAEVENGDMFVPAQKRVGLPFKEISRTKQVQNSVDDEVSTLDEDNQALVWTVSEGEMGSFFEP